MFKANKFNDLQEWLDAGYPNGEYCVEQKLDGVRFKLEHAESSEGWMVKTVAGEDVSWRYPDMLAYINYCLMKCDMVGEDFDAVMCKIINRNVNEEGGRKSYQTTDYMVPQLRDSLSREYITKYGGSSFSFESMSGEMCMMAIVDIMNDEKLYYRKNDTKDMADRMGDNKRICVTVPEYCRIDGLQELYKNTQKLEMPGMMIKRTGSHYGDEDSVAEVNCFKEEDVDVTGYSVNTKSGNISSLSTSVGSIRYRPLTPWNVLLKDSKPEETKSNSRKMIFELEKPLKARLRYYNENPTLIKVFL